MESYPMRVSPDGRDIAIRNLNRIVTVAEDGPQWITTSSQWLTDAQVDDWTELVPQGDVIAVTREPGGAWNLHVNGKLFSGSLSLIPVAADAVDYVLRFGGRATLVVEDNASIEAKRASKLNPQ